MPRQQPPSGGLGRLVAVVALLAGLLSSVVYLAEQQLDKFYVFELEHLRDVTQRGIARHGNDTRGVVRYIVEEFEERAPAHVNLDEEWVFNNAGGAMGAMYIIHASEPASPSPSPPLSRPVEGRARSPRMEMGSPSYAPGITEYLIVFGAYFFPAPRTRRERGEAES